MRSSSARVVGALIGIVAAAIAATWGCGSPGSNGGAPGDGVDAASDGASADGSALPDGGDGGETSTQAPDGAVCGSASCTGVAGACGPIVDACGQKIACEACRYTPDTIPVTNNGGFVAVAAPPAGGSPLVAIGGSNSGGTLVLATKSGTTWQTEQVAPQGDGGTGVDLSGLDMAIAPDGTPWIVFVDLSVGTSSVSVAHRNAGAWTIDKLGSGISAAIAVAADGTPLVAYSGSSTAQPTGAFGAVLASYTGGAWTRTLLAASSYANVIALAVHGSQAHVAWYDGPNTTQLRYAAPTAGGVTVEDVDAIVTQGVGADLSIAVDAAGRPHIAYWPYGALSHAVRDGAWTHERVPAGNGIGNGPVRIAASPAGTLALGTLNDVAEHDVMAGFWAQGFTLQTLVPRCPGTGHLGMALDAKGTLTLAHSCDSTSIGVLTQTGIFPAGFGATCGATMTTMCTDVCGCPQSAGACCVGGTCLGPASGCASNQTTDQCGATADPQAVQACHDALSQIACAPNGAVGAVLPAACQTLWP